MTISSMSLRVTRIFAVALLIFGLSACASKVRTNITTFSNEKLPFAVGSVHIDSLSPLPASKVLEFDFYKQKLARKLKAMGYTLVESDADFIVRLGYDVTRREKDDYWGDAYYRPHFGFGYNAHFGHVIVADSYIDQFEYVRSVQIDMEKNSDAHLSERKLLEVSAVSRGRCGKLVAVFDAMLDAIFQNLRRTNGSVEQVSVPGGDSCRS